MVYAEPHYLAQNVYVDISVQLKSIREVLGGVGGMTSPLLLITPKTMLDAGNFICMTGHIFG